MNISKREWKIFIICVIITTLWIGKVLTQPFLFNKEKRQIEIRKREVEIRKLSRILADKDETRRKYKKYEQKIKSKGGITNFIQEIERVSKQSHLRVINIKPLSEEKGDFYKQNLVKIDAEGKIVDIANFIYILIDSPRIIKIKKIEIAPESEREVLRTKILFNSMEFHPIVDYSD